MTREIELHLQDIAAASRKIELYTKGLHFDAVVKDSKTMDAVIRNLSVIGKAVRHIPKEAKQKHPGIPWSAVAGMHNKIIHEYFGVDEEILWKTITENIPDLKKKIRKVK